MEIRVVTGDAPSPEADAQVIEEDTYLVLGADPEVREPAEHPLQIWTAVHEQEPQTPGDVLVREGAPLRLLAIVHDLGRDPTWREEWIETALAGALHEAARRGLRSMELPLLGARHGRLPADRFIALLRRALEATPPEDLPETLLLRVEPPAAQEVRDLVRRILPAGRPGDP